MPGQDLGAVHREPKPRAPARKVLCLQAASAEADPVLPTLDPVAAAAGFPDLVLTSVAVRARRWGGFRAAGS